MEESNVDNTKLFTAKDETDKSIIETKIGDTADSSLDDFFKKLKGKKAEWTKWRDECQRLYKLQWDGKANTKAGNHKLAKDYCIKS